MASGGKKKTTFAKLAREQKLRERRHDKQAKKDARRRAAELDSQPSSETAPAAGDAETQREMTASIVPDRGLG